MAVQKSRKTPSKRGMHRSHDRLTKPALSKDPTTGETQEIDMGHVVVGVLTGLLETGQVDSGMVDDAIKRYDIDPDSADPYIV